MASIEDVQDSIGYYMDILEKEEDRKLFTDKERSLLKEYAGLIINDETLELDPVEGEKLMNWIKKTAKEGYGLKSGCFEVNPELIKAVSSYKKNKTERWMMKYTYSAIAYGGHQDPKERVIVKGEDPKDILKTLQGYNKARVDANKMKYCYIRAKNSKTNEIKNLGKYEIASGKKVMGKTREAPYLNNENTR